MRERVQKILRQWGMASRREAEKMIEEGKVKVNGVIITLGDQADVKKDKIEVEGKRLKTNQQPKSVYLLLHKPKGVISTCDDPKKRTTVLDILPPQLKFGQGIHPVGRLDRETSGALILTNDGDFTLALTHPRYHVPKTYQVWLEGIITDEVIKKWSGGFLWEGKMTLPAPITVKKITKTRSLIEIILAEGRNRQIRRIAELFGYSVVSLHRQTIGFLKLGELNPGEYRHLSTKEVQKMLNSVTN